MATTAEEEKVVSPPVKEEVDEVDLLPVAFASIRESSASNADVVCRTAELVWNTRMKEAEELVLPLLQARDKKGLDDADSLLLASAYAEIALWRTNLGDSPETHDEALRRIVLVEERAQRQHDRTAPSSKVVSFISSIFSSEPTQDPNAVLSQKNEYFHSLVSLAEAACIQGVLLFKRQNFVKGAYMIRKGWKYFEEARTVEAEILQIKPNGVDVITASKVCFGVGMFNYMVSMIPPLFRWIVELLGFEGNRDIAVKELNRTATELLPSPRATWAKMALIGLQWFFLEQKDEAYKELEQLREKYPTSAVLWSLSAGIHRRDGELDVSTKFYQRAFENASEIPQFQLTVEYELAHNHFLQLNYEAAAPLIEQYLLKSTSQNFKAYGAFKLGFCYWMLNRRNEIKPLYATIDQWVRPTIAYDTYASRKAKEFIARDGFTATEEVIFPASNLVEAKLFDKATEFLDKADEILASQEKKNFDDVAWVLYLRGVMSKEKEAKEAAIDYFEKAHATQATVETWIKPFCDLELAELHLKDKNKDKASFHLQRSKSYSKYDFEKQAHMKSQKTQDQIAKL